MIGVTCVPPATHNDDDGYGDFSSFKDSEGMSSARKTRWRSIEFRGGLCCVGSIFGGRVSQGDIDIIMIVVATSVILFTIVNHPVQVL